MTARKATHAGSWYDSARSKLNLNLDTYLNRVPDALVGIGAEPGEEAPVPVPGARAIIAPHAGYAYSGPAAAWAYKSLDWSKAKRVFLLGPSHHYYMPNSDLSQCTSYDTPFGSLALDHDTIAALKATGQFGTMSRSKDEAEHSLEMHLPFIYKMLSQVHENPSSFPPLVPLLIGSTTAAREKSYGALLAPYLADSSNFFVISSDFCHWGTRFRYTYYIPQSGPPRSLSARDTPPTGPHIHESIAEIDRHSWEAIETGSHDAFWDAIESTGNTVCGRHPIGVMMAAIEEWRRSRSDGGRTENGDLKGTFRFVRYERSSLVQVVADSSVSYCSAYAVF